MIRDGWILLSDTLDQNDKDVTATVTQSSLFRALGDYYQHAQLLYPEQTSSIKLPSPTQVVNAEVFPISIQKRFGKTEIELVQPDLGG